MVSARISLDYCIICTCKRAFLPLFVVAVPLVSHLLIALSLSRFLALSLSLYSAPRNSYLSISDHSFPVNSSVTLFPLSSTMLLEMMFWRNILRYVFYSLSLISIVSSSLSRSLELARLCFSAIRPDRSIDIIDNHAWVRSIFALRHRPVSRISEFAPI